MNFKREDCSLESLMSSFNTRIAELQELVIARSSSRTFFDFFINLVFFQLHRICNISSSMTAVFLCEVYPVSSTPDLSAMESTLKAMELHVQTIKDRLSEEKEAIPKAEKLIDAVSRQHKKLEGMWAYVPLHLREITPANEDSMIGLSHEKHEKDPNSLPLQHEDVSSFPHKEKKIRPSPPLWYITPSELDSLSSYMRGRLTLEKINAAINDMAAYAEANFQLISAPRKKLQDNMFERALEVREIAGSEGVKGKHFFLEGDMRGPALKLDNTGKAILTVLRHLGRISETRIGHRRIIVLSKPY